MGKGVRINLGKDGISSVSFGRRDASHVTVGKRGTYVGASIQKRQPLPANLRAERPQGQLGHLERLDTERNANDGDAIEQPGTHIANRHPHTSQHEPDDVQQHGSHAAAILHGLTERGQRESRHLERLNTQWNAHNGDAQHQTDNGPAGGEQQSTQNQPQNITKKSHTHMILTCRADADKWQRITTKDTKSSKAMWEGCILLRHKQKWRGGFIEP